MPGIIPKETIARTLQIESFENESTRITEETVAMLQKYMEIFVREAVLRSATNKEQVKKMSSKDELPPNVHDDNNEILLTHEDLENITGLLLLDM